MRIEKKVFPFWERYNQSLSECIPAENKIRTNNSKVFLMNTKQVFSIRNLENFSGEYGR